MPTSLGPAEILVILIVALIVLGPKKLPEAGRQVGKAISEVRKWSQGFQDEIRGAMDPSASPPSYTQPQPGYQPPATYPTPAEAAAAAPEEGETPPPPVETDGDSVRTGSHGLISGPDPAEAEGDPAPTERALSDPAPPAPAPPEPAPVLPAPSEAPGPPAGETPRT